MAPRGDARPGNAQELQADCLAGAWTVRAGELGMLDPGDVAEAAALSAEAGDDYGSPQEAPGAHGIDDDRIAAFMRGYDDGLADCGLPLATGASGDRAPAAPLPPTPAAGISPAPSAAVPPPSPLSLPELLPAALSLPQGQPFRLHDEGSVSLADLAAVLRDPDGAAAELRSLGWREGVYRIFASDGPPPDAAAGSNCTPVASPPSTGRRRRFFTSPRAGGPPPVCGRSTSASSATSRRRWRGRPTTARR